MLDRQRAKLGWIDVLWLAFLAGLALLPPLREIHKQFILLLFGVFQLLEGRLIASYPVRGKYYTVLIKTLLATLLLGHTGGVGINSSYYPIYYVPVVTAAIYFGPCGTLLWTIFASLAYCSYLIPALQEYRLTSEAVTELSSRILFFFLAAILVNQFVTENRRQMRRYQELAETLAESNRKLQQAEADARRAERLAALGQLSAGLAHEIRNPLAVIKGSAEMLAQKLGTGPPVSAELAGFISSEVNRLNALIARFLDFARPSRLDLAPVELPAVVDRALESVGSRFPGARVSVERNYAAGLPPVLADEQLCEQVFVNLVLNAYQAMDGRPGRLRIRIAPSPGADGRPGVEVVVQDNGPGIAAELRDQIFNPFFTSKKDGVGLGLAIVAKIIDDHRGAIRLESEPERGACFRVFLPAAAKSC